MSNDDLKILRPEVRSALGAMVRADVCRDSVPTDAFDIIRAELLRLADENARLNKIESLATEQRLQMEDVELYLMDVSQPDDEDAPWCDRMKSAIELLVQDCNYAVGQKNKAEAELAEMKQSFDLRWKADMRAIDHWRREHPGDDLTWPDHADLCVWLMGELAALKARIAGASLVEIAYIGDPFIVLPDHFTVPNSLKGKTVRLLVEE